MNMLRSLLEKRSNIQGQIRVICTKWSFFDHFKFPLLTERLKTSCFDSWNCIAHLLRMQCYLQVLFWSCKIEEVVTWLILSDFENEHSGQFHMSFSHIDKVSWYNKRMHIRCAVDALTVFLWCQRIMGNVVLLHEPITS